VARTTSTSGGCEKRLASSKHEARSKRAHSGIPISIRELRGRGCHALNTCAAVPHNGARWRRRMRWGSRRSFGCVIGPLHPSFGLSRGAERVRRKTSHKAARWPPGRLQQSTCSIRPPDAVSQRPSSGRLVLRRVCSRLGEQTRSRASRRPLPSEHVYRSVPPYNGSCDKVRQIKHDKVIESQRTKRIHPPSSLEMVKSRHRRRLGTWRRRASVVG